MTQKTWRTLSPILLGSGVNCIVNFIFDPKHPDFILSEFVIAIILAAIVLETNHLIQKHLSSRYSWITNFRARFFHHFLYLTIALLFILNGLGHLYHWIIYRDLFSSNELIIINLATFFCSFIIISINWGSEFLQKWKQSEHEKQLLNKQLKETNTQRDQKYTSIKVQQGKQQVLLPIKQIRLAWFNSGLCFIYTVQHQRYLFNGSLNQLEEVFSNQVFFRITRNSLIHIHQIERMQSGSHGKIELHISEIPTAPNSFTISRLKAAKFRAWYKSSSSIIS